MQRCEDFIKAQTKTLGLIEKQEITENVRDEERLNMNQVTMNNEGH